jgi:hypothetical protein
MVGVALFGFEKKACWTRAGVVPQQRSGRRGWVIQPSEIAVWI